MDFKGISKHGIRAYLHQSPDTWYLSLWPRSRIYFGSPQ